MILADRLLYVFHWPTVYPIRLLLPAMIIISLVLHLSAFWLLPAEVPSPKAPQPPLPAKITLLTDVASGLLAARDPSWLEPGRFRDRLLTLPQPAPTWRALQLDLPSLVPAPSEVLPRAWVPSLPPLSVQARFEPRTPVLPNDLAPLVVRFDPVGPEVTDDVMDRLRVAAPEDSPGRPTELLLVLGAAGEARHVWLLQSCGDPVLDSAAQRAIRRSRFGAWQGGYQGVLRIIWGAPEAKP